MKIDKHDIDFLHSLYRMRCLSLQEIHKYFYPQKDYYKEKVVPFVESKLTTFHLINGKEYALMITQKGIDLIQKYLNIPNEIYNTNTGRVEKTILRENDVIVEEQFASHQIALNDFVLNFKYLYNKHYNKNFEYFDEKFMYFIGRFRVDGMIRLENCDLFLEQDMGTESAKQLRDKWQRYRRYIDTEYDKKRKIIVLFIIKCQKAENRALITRRTIIESFSQMFSNCFEIYVGTKEQILETCFNRIIPGDKDRTKEFAGLMRKHNFEIMDGSKLKVKLDGAIYHYYFSSKDKNGRLQYYNPNRHHKGRFQEFLADNYDYSPMTVLSKIHFHDKNSSLFDIAYAPRAGYRMIGYIVLTRDIQNLYTQLKACNLLGTKNVYFTTPERLMKLKFPKALLYFDQNGYVYSCSDAYFEPTSQEGLISAFSKNGLKEHV